MKPGAQVRVCVCRRGKTERMEISAPMNAVFLQVVFSSTSSSFIVC